MGKNYWYKMPCNFFKRHDIMILRSLPDGDALVVCFLILIGEAVHHDGYLRFSEDLPYTVEDLAVICGVNSNAGVTRYVTENNALRNGVTEPLRNGERNTFIRYVTETLQKRGLIEIEKDGTIFIPLAQEMVGNADTTNAERQKRHREKLKNQAPSDLSESVDSNGNVTRYVTDGVTGSNAVTVTVYKSKSKSKSKNIIERDKEKENGRDDHAPRARFVKPTLEEVKAYCKERKNNVDAERFYSYYESNGWRVGKNPMKDWRASVRTWERNGVDSESKKQATPAPEIPYMHKEYNAAEQAQKEMDDLDALLGDNI